MPQAVSISITRRSVVAGLALTAAPAAILVGAENAYAQAKQTTPEKSLYERLGGVFAIAAVVDHFSDAVVKNPIVGQKSKNPQVCHSRSQEPGKIARPQVSCERFGSATFRVAHSSSRPPSLARRRSALEEAHRDLRISPADSMRSQPELGRTLDFFKVPKRERGEVLAAFAAHKDEVTAGYVGKRG